jgi:uncharacterized glyoxalase superfamily protein PhnB
MHYLEKEFNRLVKYTQGLGVKVTMSPVDNKLMSAAWVIDGSEIIIFDSTKKGPLRKCLEMMHELSHHLTWVHNGRRGDLKTDTILAKDAAGGKLTKKQRKVIYDMEVHDSQLQKTIHKEINSKIPIKRLELEIEFDLWIYKYFYINDKWPTSKVRSIKFKELRSKYE